MTKKTLNLSVLNNYKGFEFKNKRRVLKIFKAVFNNELILGKLNDVFKSNQNYALDVVFVNDTDIRQVNKDFRGIDKPTDVITFSLFADDENSVITDGIINLGEIIISVDTAKKQAKFGLDYEIDLLLLHGILHLLGFDHQNEEDYNFITGVQDRIMKELYNA